jgi:hypothetical protein
LPVVLGSFSPRPPPSFRLAAAIPDPTMSKRIPARVERELREMLAWRNRPNPVPDHSRRVA